MRPEHRHELKTNDLVEWLSNLPQWFEKNRNTIIYVAVAVIVIGGFLFWYNYQKNVVAIREKTHFTELLTQLRQRKLQILYSYTQGIDASLELLELAKGLSNLAQATTNIQIAALALIEQGQILRTELHYRLNSPDQNQIQNQITEAKVAYNEAVNILTSKGEDNAKKLYPSLIAEAKFGLGLCEEELGNFDNAKQIYREIIETKEFEISTVAAQAGQRLNTMDAYQQKVVFKPPPEPALKPVTIPAELLQPTLVDANEQPEFLELLTSIDMNWLDPNQ